MRLRSFDKPLLTAVFAGSLGGFVFGYDLGGLSASTESLRAHFHLAPWLFGLTISSSVWGTVLGSIVAGQLADRHHRRDLIAFCALLYALTGIAMALSASAQWLFVLAIRFLSGMAIGGFTVACPLYLAEVAPREQRGRIVGMFQLQVGLGVIVAFSLGAVFASRAAAWQWVLGIGALPAIALCLLARKTPKPAPPSIVTPGMLPNTPQRLFRRQNTRLILIGTSIALFNQLSGVNVVLVYMLEILASAKISLTLGHRYTVLISCLGLAITLAGMAFVDRLGRKPLLYAGSAGMAFCLFMLGLAIPHHFAPVFYGSLLVAYNAFFAFSQGTVVWVYLSELFPPGIRGVGQGYGASVHWIANALLVTIFPRVQHDSKVKMFYFFALMMVFQLVVVRVWYPETKGAPLGSMGMASDVKANRLH